MANNPIQDIAKIAHHIPLDMKRLKIIKERNKILPSLMDELGDGEAHLQTIFNDMNWLIELARQTIDAQIQFVELHRDWLNLRTENDRHREALKKIAYDDGVQFYERCPEIAHQALAGVTNGQCKA